jgi:hypothetical protein
MTINFPSLEFDDAVAAVCHGVASDEQMRALNVLLRQQATARDEYILRLELHSRLASDADLFSVANRGLREVWAAEQRFAIPQSVIGCFTPRRARRWKLAGLVALAACVTLLAVGLVTSGIFRPAEQSSATSNAVAMLDQAVDAQWRQPGESPRLAAPLEPGWLRLQSGLAQIVFYSGARIVIEGPTELKIISANEAACRGGRLTAEVPPQARGFRVRTPQIDVTDLGTSFGLEVKDRRAEIHVFEGTVEVQSAAGSDKQTLQEGAGAVIESSRPSRRITADPAAFASLFDLKARSVAAVARRYNAWRGACRDLRQDPSLLVHFDFERSASADWRLQNAGNGSAVSDATLVGCQWGEGRWPEKRALEFQGVSDRVRLNVPGEYEALTLAAWVQVQGLDRKLNSLFMCDGFEPGTIHWLLRRDGVLGLTIVGAESGEYQVAASPPAITLDQFGMWLHLAVVQDGRTGRVAHYVNGRQVAENALKIKPPYRIGAAELGNWNAQGFPEDDPFMIRNFSGAMDEFCLFSRALGSDEIRGLYAEGKPQGEPQQHAEQ